MNDLSWLIYIGAVSGSASGFFAFLAVVGAVVALFGFILTMLWSDDQNDEVRSRYDQIAERGGRIWPRGLAMLICFGIVATILPDRNTVYAIAASQVGERIVKNDAVQGVALDTSKAVQQWIKKQIEPEAKKP
jgi:hypothetical protein